MEAEREKNAQRENFESTIELICLPKLDLLFKKYPNRNAKKLSSVAVLILGAMLLVFSLR
jgi:hypothetical protein